jgi:hypothetical protein
MIPSIPMSNYNAAWVLLIAFLWAVQRMALLRHHFLRAGASTPKFST